MRVSPLPDMPHVFTKLSPPSLESGTYRPIYDWCLATEHVRLAQAHQAIQAVYKHIRLPFPALNIVTDSIIWERPRKKATAEALRALLESITIRCLPKLEEHIRQQRGQEEPKQKRLKTTDLYPMRGADSEARVYRVKAPHPNTHQSGMCKLPWAEWETTAPELTWTDIEFRKPWITSWPGGHCTFEALVERVRVTSSARLSYRL